MMIFASKFFRITHIALGLLFLNACASTKTYTPEEAPQMMITKDFAPFFTEGPLQINGPDASLRVDSYLRLLRREFGYSYVLLEDGRTGYVPTEYYAPAPAKSNFPDKAKEKTESGKKGKPYKGPTIDESLLPNLDTFPTDIPPPVLIEDVAPDKKPAFRL